LLLPLPVLASAHRHKNILRPLCFRLQHNRPARPDFHHGLLEQCRRLIALGMRPKPQTRVLLVFSAHHCEETPMKLLRDQIRDHLGHVLLYLRSPMAPNDCSDAWKEWRRNVRTEPRRTKAAKQRG